MNYNFTLPKILLASNTREVEVSEDTLRNVTGLNIRITRLGYDMSTNKIVSVVHVGLLPNSDVTKQLLRHVGIRNL